MARGPLMRWLVRLAADHAEAERRRLDLEQVRAARVAGRQRVEGGLSGRQFRAGIGGLALAIPSVATAQLASRRDASVAVVGGGIAGVTAALTLADAGIPANVYESSIRIGGRMYSDTRGYWQEGQVSERCGELIDTEHKTLLSLARRFRLKIVDRLAAEPTGAEPTYYVFGQYYPKKQADIDFKPVYQALRRDLQAAGELTTFATSTPGGVALDDMSVYQWIEFRVPGGHRSPLGRLLDIAYASEYGAETNDLSALNLVYLLGYQPTEETLSIACTSDERYRIAGGIQQLPQRIAKSLRPGSIQFRWRMSAIGRDADGSVTLTFDMPRATRTVRTDHVILALPFAALRDLDFSRAGFIPLKEKAIRELGRARNGKLHLQFRSRYWSQRGPWPGISSGESYADTGYQSTYEASRGQAGTSGLLVNYTGGDATGAIPTSIPYSDARANPEVVRQARTFLEQLERVWPGITPRWNGKASLSVASLDRNLNCSYPYYRVGQYHTLRDYEGVRQGNIHFAGDHCSVEFQGYMEGGAAEGIRAAKDILADLDLKQ